MSNASSVTGLAKAFHFIYVSLLLLCNRMPKFLLFAESAYSLLTYSSHVKFQMELTTLGQPCMKYFPFLQLRIMLVDICILREITDYGFYI